MAGKNAAAHQATMHDGYKAGKIAVWKSKGVKVPASKLTGFPKAKTTSPKRKSAGKKAKAKAAK